ncbi:gluconate 2-dehydrogenase subunit 3 family protein [Winogradskyella alexanderae]|uniref:Gluconate 2-dehydrogenase subunit 3 family protein n=1 Tax=Winogradskyella alexanderae TaxID=2877123 RepID=A0ABS7XR58_9FLAO|nr:gluconate 2-dehydrogenase subunit 3 family protein [Winogradskyella alexanderae]MCA0132500.1 gluconate 2-dehydrogenase subunit 3 family protein [Winogradskyella alexanderae]
MKRREAIKGLGLSFGALLVGPGALSLLQSCAQETGPIWEPTFFAKNQVQFLNKVTDIILPKTPDSPGATEVNVPQFIDKFIKQVYEGEEQQIMSQGINYLTSILLNKNDIEDLDSLDPKDIEPILAKVLKKSKEEDEEIWKAYNEAMENESQIDDDMANYIALSNIRSLSIFAYKNSEFVGEEILAYTPVPGKQEGCIDLSETGGKAYSLSW